MKSYIYVAITVFLATGYGGCATDPLDGEVEQLSSVITLPTETFFDNAGFSSKTYDREVGGDCPSGFVRSELRVWKKDGTSASSCSGSWLSTQNTGNCRVLVHTHVGALGNVWCSTSVGVTPISGALFTYSAANTQNALQFTSNYSLSLNAGNRITVGTCGVLGALAVNDTYLRLVGPDGQTTVAENDDSCNGVGSNLVYLVPAGGVGPYTIKAGCYSSSACSGTVSWFAE